MPFNLHLKKILLGMTLLLSCLILSGQEDKRKLIQLSGLVLTADSNLPVPYTHIRIKNTHFGAIASMQGFFSLVVREHDTVEFTSVGFKKRRLLIPDGMDGNKLNVLIALTTDTLTFDETLIYPWPSKARFKQAFLAAEPNKTYYDIAMENLAPDKLKAISMNMKPDGSESQHAYMNKMAGRAGYLGGQTNYAQFPGMKTPVPLSLLDPFAWAKFIKALKDGEFKKKED